MVLCDVNAAEFSDGEWDKAGSNMSSAKKPDQDKPTKGAHAPSGNGADNPAWADGLKQLYDSVVDEPLPDSFKDLLDAFDDSTGPGDENAGTGKSS